MARNAGETRTAILDAAQGQILQRGFSATSIDAILDVTGLTKGAFFHHFSSKSDLAHALVQRFAERDAQLLDETMTRVERLSRDPLQQYLLFIGLFEEMMEQLIEPHPGCLFASYVLEAQLFDEETNAIVRRSFLSWRERLGQKLREAVAQHPPVVEFDIDDVADQANVLVEGAYIM